MREKWLKLARRNPTSVGLNSPIYFCEDHFDLPNDMLNYMEYHVMGTVSQIRMKADCVPTKFECQSDRTNRTIVVIKPMEHSNSLMKKKLPNDMVNFMEYHVMGIVSQIRMKPDCVPTKFECQSDVVGIEPVVHINVARKQKVQESKQSSSSSMHSASTNEIKVFCPKCNTDVLHTAEGIQQAQTKALVVRVYHYLEQEYEQLKKLKAKLGPLSKFAQRTALATGVSESTVLEILQEEGMTTDKAQERQYGRARKRLKQMDSSNEDTNDTMDFKQGALLASCGQGTQIEPEIQTLVVKEEPVEYHKEDTAVNEQPQVIYVKALSREEPAVKKVRKKSMLTPGMKKKQPIIYVEAFNNQDPVVKKVSKKKKITFTPGLKMKQPIIYVKALNNEQAQMNPIPVNVKVEQPDAQIHETQSEPVAEPLFVKLESVTYEESGEMETQGSKQNTDIEKEKLVKSQAQRQKEYRQRKKLENKRVKKEPKTNAQRQHEFREKQRKNVIDETLDSFLASESTKASTTEVQSRKKSRKKTNAQRCREYRERKKLQNTMVQNITAERSDECSETGQLQAKKPKTNAERRKKHYEAQKLKKQETKKIPKTAKQRSKEYYDRKKQKNQALKTLNHHSDARKADAERAKRYRENKKQKGETLDLNLARKKNNAERIKIYREKLKSEKDVSSHEDTNVNTEDVGQASCGQDVQSQIDPIAINVKVEPPDDEMIESSRLGEAEVKLEIEIGEEGFS